MSNVVRNYERKKLKMVRKKFILKRFKIFLIELLVLITIMAFWAYTKEILKYSLDQNLFIMISMGLSFFFVAYPIGITIVFFNSIGLFSNLKKGR